MDPTQRIDPNKTMLTGAPPVYNDPMRTQMMAANAAMDPMATMAMNVQAFAPGKGLIADVVSSREATMANGPAREQFLIELVAAGAATGGMPGSGTRTPLNLCLVIDRSGSMEGPPLEYVKQACAYVVDLLSPDDVLSIVTFEEMVDTLMPPQRVTNRQAIKDGIARIMPGNTTNLHGGLSLAAQHISSVNDPSRATRMIVLTDGDPTAGIKDFNALTGLASDIKSRGITATFLGFGPDYNEELLASLAKRGGGNYYYITRPELIPEIFRTELEKLMTVVARNLHLNIKIARWVTLRNSGAGQPVSNNEFNFSLADMERGSTLQQVLDFDFSNHPLGFYRVGAGKLTYDDGVSGKQEIVDLDFVMEFTADSARYSVPVNPRVRQAADIQQASRLVEKTLLGLKTNQITTAAAVSELQKTQMLLVNEGRTSEAQEVTMALRAIQSGDQGSAEKTLIGTVMQLDSGKKGP
jgi:Ca-activated chloride channel family protein